jgi:DNA-binding response OmpR family regulator
VSKVVLLREDDPDVARLAQDLLEESGYNVVTVQLVDDLLMEAGRRTPCIALIDGTSPTLFDLWWIGPKLRELGVPPVAFTAHASARAEFEADANGFVGLVPKPFDAEEFLAMVDAICWDDYPAKAPA